jgi:hypothetical protein
MARRAVVAVTCVSLFAAALVAPMTHAHDDEHASAHHNGRVVHTHSHGHGHDSTRPHESPGVQAAQDHDADDARAINPMQMVRTSELGPLGLPAAVITALPLDIRAVAVRPLVERIHGPPRLPSLPSRAPPTFLS